MTAGYREAVPSVHRKWTGSEPRLTERTKERRRLRRAPIGCSLFAITIREQMPLPLPAAPRSGLQRSQADPQHFSGVLAIAMHVIERELDVTLLDFHE